MEKPKLEVGDYVRWDKSDEQASHWCMKYGDGIMVVTKAFVSKYGDPIVQLKFVKTQETVGGDIGDNAGFFPHRFLKDVFLSAASQANRKETNGNPKAAKGE